MELVYEGTHSAIQKWVCVPGATFPAEGITLRHTLEHISEPAAFLHTLQESCGGKGRIYIEAPRSDWILERRQEEKETR